MSDTGNKTLLLIAITICLVLVINPNVLSNIGLMTKRAEAPRRVLSSAEVQLFTTTAVTGEIVMVGTNGVLIDQGQQAVRVGSSSVQLITGGVERLRISSTGNVGIGTNTPAFTTSIAYSGNNDNSTSSKYNFGLEVHNKVSGGLNNRSNLILFSDGNATQAAIGGYRVKSAENRLNGLMFLVGNEPTGAVGAVPSNTSDASASLSEAMRITPSGNVGIGKISPASELDVTGKLSINNGVAATIASEFQGLQISYTGTGDTGYGSIVATNPGSTYNPLSLNPFGGNVGIGVTSCIYKQSLTVNGTFDIADIPFGVAQGIAGTSNTFYPVVIGCPNLHNTMPSFTITRGDIHENGESWGTMALGVEFCSHRWGHNTAYVSHRSTCQNRKFVARIQCAAYESSIVVWLRGGTTYHFRGTGCYVVDNNFWANPLTLTNNEVFSAITTVDTHFNATASVGDTRTQIFSRDGNVGIGKGGPWDKLHLYSAGATDSLGIVTQNATRTWRAGIRGDSNSSYTIQDDTAGEARLIITKDGYTGIGTFNPLEKLHVYTESGVPLVLQNTWVNYIWRVGPNNDGYFQITPDGSSGVRTYPGWGTWGSSSDIRLKQDITPIEGCLTKVMQLNPVSYRFKDNPSREKKLLGLIAQEVVEVVPEVVQNKNANGEDTMATVFYTNLIPILIGAIKDQQQIIFSLADRLSKIEALLSL